MELRQKTLTPFILLAGVLVAIECTLFLMFDGVFIGEQLLISADLVHIYIGQLLLLDIILVLYSTLSILLKKPAFSIKAKNISYIQLLVGGILSVEGLTIINISNNVINADYVVVVIMIGIQSFSLGLLAISSCLINKKELCIVRGVPSYSILIFLLLLLPAALLFIK